MNALRRTLTLAASGAALLVAACTEPPPVLIPPAYVRNVARWDRWVEANVRHVEGHNPHGEAGRFNAATFTVTYDSPLIDRWANGDPNITVFIHTHEDAHAADMRLGFPQGATPIGFERGAQCVAKVVLGYSWTPPGTEGVWWDCPADQVARTADLMHEAGML